MNTIPCRLAYACPICHKEIVTTVQYPDPVLFYSPEDNKLMLSKLCPNSRCEARHNILFSLEKKGDAWKVKLHKFSTGQEELQQPQFQLVSEEKVNE